MRRDSFERFYYEKLALGEGCGCAEHATRIRDLDAAANERNRRAVRGMSPGLLMRLISLLKRKPAQRV
jgi:hypothetical protein